jgi:hypothetical protein
VIEMRTKTLFPGLKNSQRIRVMVAGFGMYMTVADTTDICTSNHNAAVFSALTTLSRDIQNGKKISGFGTNVTVYDSKMNASQIDVQIDLA